MTMKRSAGEAEFDSISSMASCLILLSRGHSYVTSSDNNAGYSNRVFECKTCNRQFPSFQALGGHRASHKKPKMVVTEGDNGNEPSTGVLPPNKLKTHGCSICGLEFSIGQALGGHMRRHRAGAVGGPQNSIVGRKSNSERVLWLDLNLTPLENELKPTTPLFCYL